MLLRCFVAKLVCRFFCKDKFFLLDRAFFWFLLMSGMFNDNDDDRLMIQQPHSDQHKSVVVTGKLLSLLMQAIRWMELQKAIPPAARRFQIRSIRISNSNASSIQN